MKKQLFSLLGAGALLLGLTTGCSSESIEPAAGDDGTVSFTLTLPSGISSRAYSDGLTATKLTYAVYDAAATAGTAPIIFNQEKTFADKQTTVELKLVTGKTYNILFWADSYGNDTNSPYTFDKAGQTITVDYSKINSNDDKYDAFFAAENDLLVNGPINREITLTRPFAQINFGTDDLETDAVKAINAAIKTTLTVKAGGIFTTLNIKDGSVSTPTTDDVTFAAVAPATSETFPYPPTAATAPTYSYLSMDYLLVDATDNSGLADLTLTAYNGEEVLNAVNVPNAPVRRNYRTNIYGSLLTSTANFNVVIVPNYDGDINKNYIAEGVNKIDDTTYEITSGNGLVWVSQQANAEVARAAAEFVNDDGSRAFKGITIQLANDIDMTGIDFTPICPSTARYFAGTFDGQGFTVSNLTASSFVKNNACAGLFGSIVGTVKNVKLTNVNINSSHYAGGVVGYSTTNGCTIQNCSVTGGTITSTPEIVDTDSSGNSTYDNGDKVGGVIGYCVYNDKIESCSASNLTITGYRDLGGLIGCASHKEYGVYVNNCTVSDITIIQDNYRTQDKTTYCDEIIGREDGTANTERMSGNTATNVVIKHITSVDNSNATEAVNALKTGANIVLTEDLDVSSTGSVVGYGSKTAPATASIDLNGHTLTVAAMSVDYSSSVTISNGTIVTPKCIQLFEKSTLNLDGVYLKSTDDSPLRIGDDRTGYETCKDNKVTIKNSTIETVATGTAAVFLKNQDNVVNIENTIIKCTYHGVYQNGTKASSEVNLTNVDISGGVMAVYMSNTDAGTQGKLTVSNCTLKGSEYATIDVKKTDVTVNNSTIINENTTQSYSFNSNGAGGKGYGIMLEGTSETTAYDGTYSFTDVTFKLSATGDDVMQIAKFNGSTVEKVVIP